MAKCPFRFNFKESKQECIKHDCEFYTHLMGSNPQTGAPMDEYGCSLKWLPVLLVENSNMTRQVSAALDRNNNTFFNALPEHIQRKVSAVWPEIANGKKP